MANLKKAISDFLQHCQFERNLGLETIRAYRIDLAQFLDSGAAPPHLDVTDIDRTHIRVFSQFLFERLKPKTVKRKIATLKVFFRFLEVEDLIVDSPFRKMNIKIILDKRLPHTLTIDEMKNIFQYLYLQKSTASDLSEFRQKQSIRDIAIIELLFATGARVTELCKLKLCHLDLAERSLRIFGKGRKERIVPICGDSVASAVQSYLNQRCKDLESSPYLFLGKAGQPISHYTVRNVVKKLAQDVGISKPVTPHTFRHTIATLLLESGVDTRFIQYFLGHSSISTTQIYVKVSDKAHREILAQRHPRLILENELNAIVGNPVS